MATPTCESCGARLEPSHLACPFCRAPTAFAREQQVRDEQARRAREASESDAKLRYEHDARAFAQTELDRLARQSLVWSGIGVIFCCLPVPSLVALVLIYRARGVARDKGFVFPTQATIALVLSGMTLLLSASFYLFAGVTEVQKQRRIHALEQQTAVTGGVVTLDRDTACALVEIHLLSRGFDSSTDVTDVKCDGALDQHGAVATLHDVTFSAGSSYRTANASLHRGARWVVESVADANGPPSSGTATSTATVSPVTPPTPGPKPVATVHVPPHHDAGAPAPAKSH